MTACFSLKNAGLDPESLINQTDTCVLEGASVGCTTWSPTAHAILFKSISCKTSKEMTKPLLSVYKSTRLQHLSVSGAEEKQRIVKEDREYGLVTECRETE